MINRALLAANAILLVCLIGTTIWSGVQREAHLDRIEKYAAKSERLMDRIEAFRAGGRP